MSITSPITATASCSPSASRSNRSLLPRRRRFSVPGGSIHGASAEAVSCDVGTSSVRPQKSRDCLSFNGARSDGNSKYLGLVDPAKLVQAPLGVSPAFTDQRDPGGSFERLDALEGSPWILHVGSCIPRKRIDVLLNVVAEVRLCMPHVGLLKIGGEWTEEQRSRIDGLRLAKGIVHLTDLSETELAEAYSGASIVVVPSDAEGFGLPVVEALACGWSGKRHPRALGVRRSSSDLRTAWGRRSMGRRRPEAVHRARSRPDKRTRLEWAR